MKHQVSINGTVTVDTSQLAALASLGLPMTIRPVTDEPAVRRGRPPRIVMTHEPVYEAPTQAPIPIPAEPVAAVTVAAAPAAPAAEKPKAEKVARVKVAKPEPAPAMQEQKRKPDPKAPPQSNRDSVVAAFTELIDVDFDSAAAVLEKLKVGKFSEIGDDRLAEAAGLIAAGLKANTQPQQ